MSAASEHSLSPSEASLNARWYSRIQRWVGDAGWDGEEERPGRRHTPEEGTESGTVLPIHSISRRASRELRTRRGGVSREGDETDQARLGAPRDVAAHEEERWTRTQSPASVFGTTKPCSQNYTAASPTKPEKTPIRKSGQRSHPASTSFHPPPPPPPKALRPNHLNPPFIESQRIEQRPPPLEQPARGRRPPTPFHPPRGLALSQVPEESTVGGSGGGGGSPRSEALSRDGIRKERKGGTTMPYLDAVAVGEDNEDDDDVVHITTKKLDTSLASASAAPRKRYPPSSIRRNMAVAPHDHRHHRAPSHTSSSKDPKGGQGASHPASANMECPAEPFSRRSSTQGTHGTHKDGVTGVISPFLNDGSVPGASTIVLPATVNPDHSTTNTNTSFTPLPFHRRETTTLLPDDSISRIGKQTSVPHYRREERSSRSRSNGRARDRSNDRFRKGTAGGRRWAERGSEASSSSSGGDTTSSLSPRRSRNGDHRVDSDSDSSSDSVHVIAYPNQGAYQNRTSHQSQRTAWSYPSSASAPFRHHQRFVGGRDDPRIPVLGSPQPLPPLSPANYALIRPFVAQPIQQQLQPAIMHRHPPSTMPFLLPNTTGWSTASISGGPALSSYPAVPAPTHTQPSMPLYGRGSQFPGTSSMAGPAPRRGSLSGFSPLMSLGNPTQQQQGVRRDAGVNGRRPPRAASAPVQGVRERPMIETRYDRARRMNNVNPPRPEGPRIVDISIKPRRSPAPRRILNPAPLPPRIRNNGNDANAAGIRGRRLRVPPPPLTPARITPAGTPQMVVNQQKITVGRRGSAAAAGAVRSGGGLSAGRLTDRHGAVGLDNRGGGGGGARNAARASQGNQRKAGSAGGEGGGWVKGLLPPYGRKVG